MALPRPAPIDWNKLLGEQTMKRTQFYLHLMADSVTTDPMDMNWIKVTPRGWFKVKFDKATPFDSEEDIKKALIQPTFAGVTGAMITVQQDLTILGRS